MVQDRWSPNAVARHVTDPRLLDLVWRYLHRSTCDGGDYHNKQRGIPRGCPLSPLLGALCLADLEAEIGQMGLFIARSMDDWVVLPPTRWKLREGARRIRVLVAALGLELHPDKTFVGRIDHGFEFLGYRYGPEGVQVADGTILKFVGRACQLYEQGADEARIGTYVRRWVGWEKHGFS